MLPVSFSFRRMIFGKKGGRNSAMKEGSDQDGKSTTGSRMSRRYRLADIGFSFAPAGLLFPYYLGVIRYLTDMEVITPNVPLSGSSAGALAVMTAGLRLDTNIVFKLLYGLEFNFHVYGTRGRMKKQLEKQLRRVISASDHQVLNNRPQCITINYSKVGISGFTPTEASHFHSREDLIDCLMASCNIPFYFTNAPVVSVRGAYAVDGFFSDPKNLGCPEIDNVRKHIRVLPFDASRTLPHIDTTLTISPGLAAYDHLLSDEAVERFLKYISLSAPPSPAMVQENGFPLRVPPSTNTIDIPLSRNEAADRSIARDSEFPRGLNIPTHCGMMSSKARESHDAYDGVTIRSDAASPLNEAQGVETAPIITRSPVLVQTRGSGELSVDEADAKGEHWRCRGNMVTELADDSIQDGRLTKPGGMLFAEMESRDTERKKGEDITAPQILDDNCEVAEESNESYFTSVFSNMITSPLDMWKDVMERFGSEEPQSELKTEHRGLPGGNTLGWSELLSLALTPPESSEVIVQLYELGRADAFRWLELFKRSQY